MAPRHLGSWEAKAMSEMRTTRAAGPGRTPRMVCCLACRQEMPSSTLMHVHRWRGRCGSLAATRTSPDSAPTSESQKRAVAFE